MKKKSVFIITISCVIFSWFIFVVRQSVIQADIDSKNLQIVGQNIVNIPPVVDTTNYNIKPVTVKNVDNMYYMITLDYNSGLSHKEMGELLGKEIKDNIPNYAAYCDKIMAPYLGGGQKHEYTIQYYVENTKRLMKNIDKDYVDELEGMASQLCNTNETRPFDNKLSKDEFLFMNFIQEVVLSTDCSASSIYGNKTVDGKTISGVNIDMDISTRNTLIGQTGKTVELDASPMRAISAITIYKQGDKSFCNIGYAGLMGVNSAFNDDKVFTTLINTETEKPGNLDDVRTTAFDLRYALENNKTMDETIAFMADEGHKYYKDNIILFSDPDTSKVLENDLRIGGNSIKRAVRTADSELNDSVTWGIPDSVAIINSFMLKGNNDNLYKYNNKIRLERFRKLITEKGDSSDFQDMKEIMSFTNSDENVEVGSQFDGSIYNIKSLQSIVFKPEDMELEVAFAPAMSNFPEKPNFTKVTIDFK